MHSHLGGRGALFLASQHGHVGTRDGTIRSARIPVGHDAVGDVDPRLHPYRYRSRHSEIDIVGMRAHHQDLLDACEVVESDRGRVGSVVRHEAILTGALRREVRP